MNRSVENVKKLIELYNGKIIEIDGKNNKIESITCEVRGKTLTFENQKFSTIPFGTSKPKLVKMVGMFAKQMNLLLFYENRAVVIYDNSDIGYDFFKNECTDIILKENDVYRNKKIITLNDLMMHNVLKNFNEIEFKYKAGKFIRSIKFQLVELKCDIKTLKIANLQHIGSDYANLINYIIFSKTKEYIIDSLKEKFELDEFKDRFIEESNKKDLPEDVIKVFNHLFSEEKEKIKNYLLIHYKNSAIRNLNIEYSKKNEKGLDYGDLK